MHADLAEEMMTVTNPTQIFTQCWSLLALSITFHFFGMEAKMLFQTQGCPLQTFQIKNTSYYTVALRTLHKSTLCSEILPFYIPLNLLF